MYAVYLGAMFWFRIQFRIYDFSRNYWEIRHYVHFSMESQGAHRQNDFGRSALKKRISSWSSNPRYQHQRLHFECRVTWIKLSRTSILENSIRIRKYRFHDKMQFMLHFKNPSTYDWTSVNRRLWAERIHLPLNSEMNERRIIFSPSTAPTYEVIANTETNHSPPLTILSLFSSWMDVLVCWQQKWHGGSPSGYRKSDRCSTPNSGSNSATDKTNH